MKSFFVVEACRYRNMDEETASISTYNPDMFVQEIDGP